MRVTIYLYGLMRGDTFGGSDLKKGDSYTLLVFIKPHLQQRKKNGLLRGMVSFESYNLLVISEKWPDEKGRCWGECPYKRGTTIHNITKGFPSFLNKLIFLKDLKFDM